MPHRQSCFAIAAHQPDLHQTAAFCQRLAISLEIGFADHIENDVDAIAAGCLVQHRNEILHGVIDPMCRYQRPDLRHPRRAGREEHFVGDPARQLHRCAADTACTAMDQRAFAGLQRSQMQQRLMGGDERFGDCRSLHKTQRRGNVHRHSRRDARIFRIPPAPDDAHHAVADRKASHVTGDGYHFPGHFQAHQGGIAEIGSAIGAFALVQVGTVDARGVHFDQQITRAEARLWNLDNF